MDPFHVARLVGDALDLCRRRVQQARHGHRGRKGDPLCNGRLEHLRGPALGLRNLTNYIARSLLEAGGFRQQLHPGL
jgi:transposase